MSFHVVAASPRRIRALKAALDTAKKRARSITDAIPKKRASDFSSENVSSVSSVLIVVYT